MADVVAFRRLEIVLERLFSQVGGAAGGMYGGHKGRNVGVRIQRLLDLILAHARNWATKLCNVPALKALQEFLGSTVVGRLAPAIANMVRNFAAQLHHMIPIATEALGRVIGARIGRYLGGKIGAAFARGLRVGVRIAGRAVPVIGLAFIIWDLVELFDDDKGGRAKFVEDLAKALANSVAGQGLNVLVISTKSKRKNNLHNVLLQGSVQYKKWEYEYFIFESGGFEILGDGGYINWGMEGWFHDYGKAVEFIAMTDGHDIDELAAELQGVEEEWKAEDAAGRHTADQFLRALVPIASYRSGRYLEFQDGSVYDQEKKVRIRHDAAANLLKCLRAEGNTHMDHLDGGPQVVRYHKHGRYTELSDGTFLDRGKPGVVLRGKDAHKLRQMLHL